MKILIVGGGGREHALAWKCAQPPYIKKVFCAPGNAGTALEQKVVNVPIEAENIIELAAFAEAENIDLTIVGPEGPLVMGIVDTFRVRGLLCFGPTKSAAILEGSKVFTKEFLSRHDIPTASYASFDDLDRALMHLKKVNFPVVVKADGLAAGKGVFISACLEEAERAVTEILRGGRFGAAGKEIVIEEFLQGEELSYICMTDGYSCIPFASSQDHKARDDADKGPNTGGMGAYSPAPILDSYLEDIIIKDIIKPTLSGLRQEGRRYEGFLYAGLMIDTSGNPKVLEFNCRFGDPETQPIIMRLKTDLVAACERVMKKDVAGLTLEFDERVALGVVLAAKGYPGKYKTGMPLNGLRTNIENPHVKIFHAGTELVNGECVSKGGRVACSVGMGKNVKEAQDRAYHGISRLSGEHFFFRSDIGYRAINREEDR